MVDYIRRLARAARYRHLVWDTAPLGQTLALLGMPSMLAEHLTLAPRIYSHLRTSGEHQESLMAVIRGWQTLAADCMDFLRHAVRFSMVTIPEALAVEQLGSVVAELERYGLGLHRLIVNNVVEVTDSPFLRAKRDQQQPQLETLRRRYGDLPLVEIPLFPGEVRGLDRLRTVGRQLVATPALESARFA
jgi:arsenite-transporting ATPase